MVRLDTDDFVIDYTGTEQYAMSERDDYTVFVSISRNRQMMARGLVKDVARRLQALRKERGYNPTDILNVASVLDLNEESLDMLTQSADELKFLVRVKRIDFTPSCKKYDTADIDGQQIRISVE